MAELRLRRDSEDRKRYVLEGVGELRLAKWYRRGAVVSSDDGRWELSSRAWSPGVTATDAGGAEAATYQPRGAFKRGGDRRWRWT